MAIEFGADNRPTSSVFGTGKGADQESRKLHASMAMRLGVRAGKCRSCGDVGRCTPCLTADASVKINGAPVSALDMAPDGSLTPSAPPTATDSRPSSAPSSKLAFGSTERPLGADTLEDWT